MLYYISTPVSNHRYSFHFFRYNIHMYQHVLMILNNWLWLSQCYSSSLLSRLRSSAGVLYMRIVVCNSMIRNILVIHIIKCLKTTLYADNYHYTSCNDSFESTFLSFVVIWVQVSNLILLLLGFQISLNQFIVDWIYIHIEHNIRETKIKTCFQCILG